MMTGGSRLMRWYFRDGASCWRSPDAAQRVSGAPLFPGPSYVTERYRAPERVRDIRYLPRIKDKTGDDEHSRHRQHLRERFRGRPFTGFLHAVLPRLGHDSSLRGCANGDQYFTRNTPRRVFAGLSPHSCEYRQCQARTAMRRHFGSRAAGSWARDGNLKAIFGRHTGSRVAAGRCSAIAGSLLFRMELSVRQNKSRKPKVNYGPHRLLRYFEIE
jgi:hypothetical protein